MRLAQIPCGSWLARESGVPGTEFLTELPLSQASQLPHLIVFAWFCWIIRLLSLERDNELDIQAMFS